MVFLRIILVDIGTFQGEQNNFWNKWSKHGQIVHVGGVLKTSRPADFKSATGFEN